MRARLIFAFLICFCSFLTFYTVSLFIMSLFLPHTLFQAYANVMIARARPTLAQCLAVWPLHVTVCEWMCRCVCVWVSCFAIFNGLQRNGKSETSKTTHVDRHLLLLITHPVQSLYIFIYLGNLLIVYVLVIPLLVCCCCCGRRYSLSLTLSCVCRSLLFFFSFSQFILFCLNVFFFIVIIFLFLLKFTFHSIGAPNARANGGKRRSKSESCSSRNYANNRKKEHNRICTKIRKCQQVYNPRLRTAWYILITYKI